MRSLNQLLWLQRALIRIRLVYYNKFWGMSLDPTVRMSLTVKFDKTYPKGMHIGAETYVAFGAAILTHDRTRGVRRDTIVGKRCFIGARSMILPGVRIGDESIVAAGAIVTKDVPPRSIVAGNPAQIIRSNIEVGAYGRFLSADPRPEILPDPVQPIPIPAKAPR
jgi:acetyltransferase-like isoleucine patch superfamily enzyme